jgi:hypothetical protein
MGGLRWLGRWWLAGVSAIAMLHVAVSHSALPVKCPLTTVDGLAASDADCCQNLPPEMLLCDEPSENALGGSGDPPNLFVVVADDHAYCQYGFMHGFCDESGAVCRSNVDCPSGETCVADHSGEDNPSGHLRLSDWSCRYRQPPRRAKACKGCLDQAVGDFDAKAKGYRFDHTNAPCTDTPSRTAPSPQPGICEVPNPVPLTPHIDELATTGAVFTRVQMGGNACKPSRATLIFGKHQRHLKEMATDATHPPTLANWLLGEDDGGLNPVSAYKTFLLGKGEVIGGIGLDHGGFLDGDNSVGPRAGRYKCHGATDGPACRAAVCAPDDDACEAALVDVNPSGFQEGRFPQLPAVARGSVAGLAPSSLEAVFALLFDSSHGVVASTGVTGDGTCPDDDCTSEWRAPFLMWYAPKMPHKGGAGGDYIRLYGGHQGKWAKHYARVTQFDQIVGTVVDELRRSCVCVPNGSGGGEVASLYDRTVVVVVSDHGLFLPSAKFAPTENTHRATMIINPPGDRRTRQDPPLVVEDELVNAIDLFPTLLAYAGYSTLPPNPVDPGDSDVYPFARNLKPVIDGTGSVGREMGWGEDAGQGGTRGVDTSGGRMHYLMVQADNTTQRIGMCVSDTVDSSDESGIWGRGVHAKPCVENDDCPNSSCDLTTKWKRCINNPSLACATDTDCLPNVEELCDDGDCRWNETYGSLADMARPDKNGVHQAASADCLTAAECRPRHVVGQTVEWALELCRPVLLRVEAEKDSDATNVRIERVFDLHWDPDLQRDLRSDKPGQGNASYLGDKLGPALTDCLREYWTLLGQGDVWKMPGDPDCPWEF